MFGCLITRPARKWNMSILIYRIINAFLFYIADSERMSRHRFCLTVKVCSIAARAEGCCTVYVEVHGCCDRINCPR